MAQVIVARRGPLVVFQRGPSGTAKILAGNDTANAARFAGNSASSATLSQEWAEGTEPGGPGTKSAKGWADEAAATVANKPDRLLTLPIAGSDGGTANAQTVSAAPTGMTAYVSGQTFIWLPNATNTASDPTLDIIGLGARIVKNATGGAVSAGDVINGCIYLMRMSATSTVRILGILPSEIAAQVSPVSARVTTLEEAPFGVIDNLAEQLPNLFTIGEVDATITGAQFRATINNGAVLSPTTVGGVGAWSVSIPSTSEAGAWLGGRMLLVSEMGASGVVSASIRIISLTAYSGGSSNQSARVLLVQRKSDGSEIVAARRSAQITTTSDAVSSPVPITFSNVPIDPLAVSIDLYIGVQNTGGSSARTLVFDRILMAGGAVAAYRRPVAIADADQTAFESMTVLPSLPITPDPALVPSAPSPRQDGGAVSGGFTCTGIDKITRGIYAGCWAISSDGRVREGDGSSTWPRIAIVSADFRHLVTYFDLPGVGDGIQGMAVDTSGATDTVWVAAPGVRQIRQYELYGANAGLEVAANRISLASGFLPGNGGPNGLAYIASEDRFFVGVSNSATISRLSKAGAIINQVTVGTAVPDQLHYDDTRGLLYASAGSNGSEGTVWMHRLSNGTNTQPFGSTLPRATAIEGIYVDRLSSELVALIDGGFHWTSNPWPLNGAIIYSVALPT